MQKLLVWRLAGGVQVGRKPPLQWCCFSPPEYGPSMAILLGDLEAMQADPHPSKP